MADKLPGLVVDQDDDSRLVPPPVLLLCWKHHAQVIHARIAEIVSRGDPALAELPTRLLTIGESQMDLYLGRLSPRAIASALITSLRADGVLERDAYRTWLAEHAGYRTLELLDGSRWVLRWGREIGRYIHIHPARHAPQTVRARALPLKTAIVALAWAGVHQADPCDIVLVNQARRSLLGLAPLRSLSADSGTGALIKLLLGAADGNAAGNLA